MAKVSGPTLRPGGLRITQRALDFCALPQGAKVVDVGCGPGQTLKLLISLGFEAWGLDIDPGYLAMAAKFGPTVQGRLESLSLSLQEAEAVFCECVLNLSSDRLASLAEIFKVLKPGGYFVLGDIFSLEAAGPKSQKSQNQAPSCLAGALSLKKALSQIEGAGFEVKLIEDHGQALKTLAAQLVWAYGQAGLAFLPYPRASCAPGAKTPKLTYALVVSQKAL